MFEYIKGELTVKKIDYAALEVNGVAYKIFISLKTYDKLTENIEKLFRTFERLDVERTTTAEGTGAGLAITKKLVELMGGKIDV